MKDLVSKTVKSISMRFSDIRTTPKAGTVFSLEYKKITTKQEVRDLIALTIKSIAFPIQRGYNIYIVEFIADYIFNYLSDLTCVVDGTVGIASMTSISYKGSMILMESGTLMTVRSGAAGIGMPVAFQSGGSR